MNSFRWISVVLSMLLGLGVTRVLSAAVAAFRSRHQARLDWLPFAWAACIFGWQLQFWWGIIELEMLVATWTLPLFLLMVLLVLLLFVAAALVLPFQEMSAGDSLLSTFERDGRWALLALSLYHVGGLFTDWLLWQQSPFTALGVSLVALAALPVLAFAYRDSRRIQVVAVLLYLPIGLWSAIAASPSAY
jgi:hypothetical protein